MVHTVHLPYLSSPVVQPQPMSTSYISPRCAFPQFFPSCPFPHLATEHHCRLRYDMRQCIERLGQAYNLHILPLKASCLLSLSCVAFLLPFTSNSSCYQVGIPRSHSGVDESLQQHHHCRGLVVGIFPPNDRTACLHYTPHKHTRAQQSRRGTPISQSRNSPSSASPRRSASTCSRA
ncbi:hypothetical protein EDB85DRAFT_991909 [Lactarius pseudohatsudake]|nr:hypothetical protein EDB85DRAFT_991909 [Lactarius pseudohatsudake]